MKIIIAGKSGSGKDFLKNKLIIEKGLKPNISCTTRPAREGERDGETYHFMNEEEFMVGIKEGDFVEYQRFNGWLYGTPLGDWKRADVFIMTPSGIRELDDTVGLENCRIIYLDIDQDTRRQRMEARIGDSDSVERRIEADEEDFKDFRLYDIRTQNPHFTVTDIWTRI
jgi:guanylate kinase